MSLKKTILEVMGRDELKAACQELDLTDCNYTRLDSMRDALRSSKAAKPWRLLEHLYESQVKEVAERMGVDPTGRKNQLIARLLGSSDEAKEPVAGQTAGHQYSAPIRDETLGTAVGEGAA